MSSSLNCSGSQARHIRRCIRVLHEYTTIDRPTSSLTSSKYSTVSKFLVTLAAGLTGAFTTQDDTQGLFTRHQVIGKLGTLRYQVLLLYARVYSATVSTGITQPPLRARVFPKNLKLQRQQSQVPAENKRPTLLQLVHRQGMSCHLRIDVCGGSMRAICRAALRRTRYPRSSAAHQFTVQGHGPFVLLHVDKENSSLIAYHTPLVPSYPDSTAPYASHPGLGLSGNA